jgi:radical SAM superfamily enzyme YgiQ (UPF0313 family)
VNRQLKVLLINPYIYDVSAYGFWSSPLGLLYVGSILRENGMHVTLLDCLPEQEDKRKEDGRAPFVKQRVENPPAAAGVKKKFRRYGMSRDEVATRLTSMSKPDLVLVTCIMTYWYQGAEEIVRLVREMFPAAKIVVGGIYVSLCYEHARVHMAAADLIVRNNELDLLYAFIEDVFGIPLTFKPGAEDLRALPYPAFDLYRSRRFVPLLTSFGCIYRCTYCATSFLHPAPVHRDAKSVVKEIVHWKEFDISRFALYDDNFLFDGRSYAKPLLATLARLPFDISVYNPNALNAALIDSETARLLWHAHFREIRLGLETIDPAVQMATGGKVTRKGFENAVACLLDAGFPRSAVQAYVLAGLPEQRHEDVRRTVDYALGLGVRVHLAEYTPIPETEMYERYYALARYPVAEEPLYQNNALFPFAWEGFTDEDMDRVKAHVREGNNAL